MVDITQAPTAIAAQSALSVASLAVQGFADVETLGGDSPLSLFCLTIAESGERKSTCDRLLMRGVREYEQAEDETYRADLAEHEVQLKVWTKKRERLMTEAAGAKAEKAAGARADLAAMGPEPMPPMRPNLTAMDPTFEGLMKLYGIGRPSLGLFSDEAGGFIGGHAMNSDNRLKTMAGLSCLWNGEPIDRTRAGDGSQIYRGRRLAAHLMVQPVAVRPLLADPLASRQGFTARFLITEPPSRIGTRLKRGAGPESARSVDRFTARLTHILQTDLPTDRHPQELTPRRLTLSPSAKELLYRFAEAVELAQAAGQDMEQVRAYASKAAEQATRISGVLTLWADLDAAEVTPQAMGWGITLAQFYLGEAKRLAEAGGISIETENAELVRHWLLEECPYDEVTIRDIVQRGPNRLRETKTIRAAVAILENYGWLVRLPADTVVRDAVCKEAYRIVRPANAV
ncbi:YfjI family protein [Thioclava sp. GXIMD4216]|uniref:YfjI family protein n=1 Tax=Thioclava sp. GXIMD4216 TaxID=3131929 RepID=UPI0030D34525